MTQNNKQLSAVEYMPLERIDYKDQRFQTRYTGALFGAKQYRAKQAEAFNHQELYKELVTLTEQHKADTRKAHLKPIVVFKPADKHQLIIVSGFHRYAAYLLFNKETTKANSKKKVIKVQIFTGTEDEALLFSSGEDIKPNIPKTHEQRCNAAWILVCSENTAAKRLKAQDLAAKCGVSKPTINRMRQAKRYLDETNGHFHDNWKLQQFTIKNPDHQRKEDADMEGKIHKTEAEVWTKYFVERFRGDERAFGQLLVNLSRRLKAPPTELETIMQADADGNDF